MKGLLKSAVRRPVGVSIIYLAIALFGFVAMQQLAVDLLPAVDVPRISITTRYEGVAPQEIETLITRPVEQAVSTIEGVEQLEGVSSEGLSRVSLAFEWGTPLDEALDDVRVAVDRLRERLPEEADTPSVFKFDLSSVPIAYLGLTGSGDPRRIKFLADDQLGRALERVPGVASVSVQGGRDREIRVALDPARLSALNVSATEVSSALARENRTLSAGDMVHSGRSVVIRAAGEFESLEDIGNVVVTTRDGAPVFVRDLAKVQDLIRKVRSELWIDGKPGIRLRIYKQSGANTVEVVDRLRQEVNLLNKTYGVQAQLTFLWDSSSFIRAAVGNVQSAGGVGAFLAILTLLVFLRSWRATLVVATAIPISILATFALMYFQGMTLNVISFGGLALGIGMVVDGAIVVLENIHKKRTDGLAAAQAAVEGSEEMATPVIAGTLTTIAVFAPVVFVGGFSGVFFSEMAQVVTFALLCSLAVALSLVPMLAGRLFRKSSGAEAQNLPARLMGATLERLEQAYARTLGQLLQAPWAIVMASVALLASAIMLVPRVGVELMPESDEGQLEMDMELPVGTPLETTSAVVREVERQVKQTLLPGELRHTVSSAGPEAWWRPTGSNEGEIELLLVPAGERQRNLDQIQAGIQPILDAVPGARFRMRPSSSNAMTRVIRRGQERLAVEIRGHDLVIADRLAERVVAAMREVDGVTFARPNRELGHLERVLKVDRARAAELGLSGAQVAETVEHYVLGKVSTRYRDRGDEFDIRVELSETARANLDQLPELPIVTPSGQRVPLRSLVRIEEREGPSSITRVDQERNLVVDGGSSGRSLADIGRDLKPRLEQIAVPEGFSIALSGEFEGQRDTFADLLLGIFLAVFLVYAAMAVQFESVRLPLVVMVAVPFGFVGVVLMLLLTGTTFNMNSALGSIVLVGVVVNNAIVLIDGANRARRQGEPARTAILGAARRRLRPILMTTLTTLLGLLPLALGTTEGSEIQGPLARAIVGGLLSSTLVTLLLVPSVYLLVEGRRESKPSPLPHAAVASAAAE